MPDPCLRLEFIASAPYKSVTGLKKLYIKFLLKFINSNISRGSITNVNNTKIIIIDLVKKIYCILGKLKRLKLILMKVKMKISFE